MSFLKCASGLPFAFFCLFSNPALPQGGCVEIESILVTACIDASNPEGYNEMILFRIGPNPLPMNDLFVVWPGSVVNFGAIWRGLVQPNTVTAEKVAEINASIRSCGHLKEPVNGTLPAGSRVLLFTSYRVSATNNSFVNLSDTVIAIFQNNPPSFGNPFLGDHFLNYATSQPQEQKTFISFDNGQEVCYDEVTYHRNLLVRNNGQPGDEGGAKVAFTPRGAPTYLPAECTAPVAAWSAEWTNPENICILGGPVDLNGYVTGTLGGSWSGPGMNGSVLNPGGLIGNITLSYTVTPPSGCTQEEPQTVSHTLVIKSPFDPTWVSPGTVCNTEGVLDLNQYVTGTPGGTWQGAINLSPEGIWNIAGMVSTSSIAYYESGLCGDTLAFLINVVNKPDIPPVTGTIEYCPGEEPEALAASPAGNNQVSWYSDPELTNEVGTGNTFVPPVTTATYYVTQRNAGCASEPQEVSITVHEIEAQLSVDSQEGFIDHTVTATGESVNATECEWWLNKSLITVTGSDTTFVFTEERTDTLKLICVNDFGCISKDSVIIVTLNNATQLEIPNVFSPDGDGKNDLFQVKHNGIKTFSASIFNRWGKLLFEWNDVANGWDGTVSGKKATDGVYFYVISGTDITDKPFEEKGTVALINSGK